MNQKNGWLHAYYLRLLSRYAAQQQTQAQAQFQQQAAEPFPPNAAALLHETRKQHKQATEALEGVSKKVDELSKQMKEDSKAMSPFGGMGGMAPNMEATVLMCVEGSLWWSRVADARALFGCSCRTVRSPTWLPRISYAHPTIGPPTGITSNA